MTEEELKKLFKAKLENREFEFNPDNWKAMESMLDRKKTRAGGFYWGSVAAIVSFGLLVGSLIFIEPGAETKARQNFISDDSGSKNIPLEEPTEPAPGAEAPDSREVDAVAEPAAQPIERDFSESENVRNENIAGGSAKTEPEAEQPKDDMQEERMLAGSGGDNSETPTRQNLNSDHSKSEPNKAIAYTEAQSLQLPVKDLGEPELPEADLAQKGFIEPDALLKFRARHEFFAMAGANVSGSYGQNTAGLGWAGGLGYKFRFAPGFSLNAAVNYSVQNDMGITEHTDSTFFRFGKEVVENEREVSRLEYLEVPLSLSYELNPAHELELGMYAARLISVKQDRVRTLHHSKAPTEIFPSSSKGYDTDFRKYDYGLTFGYRYNFSPAMSVGFQLRQGLTDITKDVSEDFGQRHENLTGRISLRYRLF